MNEPERYFFVESEVVNQATGLILNAYDRNLIPL